MDAGAGKVEDSAEINSVVSVKRLIQEPFIGMEFDSEDAAKDFYDGYSRRVGFVMLEVNCRHSEVDQSIISRRFSCNKHGYYIPPKEYLEAVQKQSTSSEEGCNAMMLVKLNPSGKWVVTKFENEHTHQLVDPDPLSLYPLDSKESKIQALALELKRQNQLCDLYRQDLIPFLESLEDQNVAISTNIKKIVHHLRDFEAEQIQNRVLLARWRKKYASACSRAEDNNITCSREMQLPYRSSQDRFFDSEVLFYFVYIRHKILSEQSR